VRPRSRKAYVVWLGGGLRFAAGRGSLQTAVEICYALPALKGGGRVLLMLHLDTKQSAKWKISNSHRRRAKIKNTNFPVSGMPVEN
jgi:hypothetical protein